MINIVADNDSILLDGLADLESYQISNVEFWGFKRENDLFIQDLDLAKIALPELVDYLKSENIQYELCDKCLEYLAQYNLAKNEFQDIKTLGRNFKNGVINSSDYNDFVSFLKVNVKRELKDHQKKSAYHLYILGNAANFSVPGSGKTSVVLSVYEKLRLEGRVNTLFVVGPLSSFSAWQNEFLETLNRSPKSIILAGGDLSSRKLNYYVDATTKHELYLTSFQTLLSDREEVRLFFAQTGINIFLVIDEAHYIKKIEGEWANAVLNIGELAKNRAVLTGTPLPKSYSDIFNLFDFLWPQNQPISSENKIRLKDSEEKQDYDYAKEILDDEIGPLFYRVRKIDLGLSKQNFIEPTLIEMNHNERTIYDSIYTKIKEYSQSDYFQNIDIITKLCKGRMMRLRQAVSYTKLLDTAIDSNEPIITESFLEDIIKYYDDLEVPSKVIELLKQLNTLSNNKEKVVIWSNFIGTIDLIEKHIRKAGINCSKIYGQTPVERTGSFREEETRERIIDRFIDPDSSLDVLIANPAACAESISLHKTCHHAIYYDLSYNCAQYLQSLDRIHRVGGSEKTIANYHYLQYANTIDTDIKKNLDKKAKKMFDVIEEDYGVYSLDMFEPDDDDLEAYKRIFKTNI